MRDMALAGVGMGLVFVPMLIAVQSAVPRAVLGSATSRHGFFRTIGGAVGVAVMGSAMAQRLHRELAGLLATAPAALQEPAARLAAHPDLIVNPMTRAALGAEVLARCARRMAHAVGSVFVVGLVVAVAALASAFLVPPGQARDLAVAQEPVDALGVLTWRGDTPLLDRLAGLPPVSVAELLGLLERMPDSGTGPDAGRTGRGGRGGRAGCSPAPRHGDRAPQAKAGHRPATRLCSKPSPACGTPRCGGRWWGGCARPGCLPTTCSSVWSRCRRRSASRPRTATGRERGWRIPPPRMRARAAVHGAPAPRPARVRRSPGQDSQRRASKGEHMIHLHEKNQERKRLNGLIAKSTMKVPAAVGEVGKRVFADGVLSKKHKELTALAVAVVQNCFD